MKKITILILALVGAWQLLSFGSAIWAEESAYYEPYPLVFVHGYNNVGAEHDKLWATTLNNYKKYFYDENSDPRYFSDYDYCQVFDYAEASNGDIDMAAEWLKGYIDYVLKNVPKYQKEEERKVIIVAHSAGGLVTKRFLAKYPDYKNKIKRVVFLGTPHLGSPLASGLILMDRLRPELERIKNDNAIGMKRMSRGTVEENEQYVAYLERYNAISSTLDWYEFVVNFNKAPLTIKNMFAGYGQRYNPKLRHDEGQKVTLGQLVVPEAMTGSRTFSGASLWGGKVVAKASPITTEPSYYAESETFINNKTFELPSDYKVIMGNGSWLADIAGKTATVAIRNSIDLSDFPSGNTLEDLDRGDGIVTHSSQQAIGNADYSVNAFHTDEPKAFQAILQAIDDPPVIESIRFQPDNFYLWETHNYDIVIIKVKDYLLADIEIAEITAGGIPPMDLQEYYDSDSKTYKPYVRFGKNFLKERDYVDGDTKIHLMPGEFIFKVNPSIGSNTDWKIHVKIRNAAKKEALANVYGFTWYCVSKAGNSYDCPDWPSARDVAYDSFCNSPIYTGRVTLNDGSIPGGDVSSWISRSSYDGKYYWSAQQDMIIKSWANFKLDIDNIEKVKSIKFIGYFSSPKEIPSWYPDRHLPNDLNFSFSMYRDTSNIWPPPFSPEYDAHDLLYKFDVPSFGHNQKVEIEIDKSRLNPNGDNVWEFKPDFSEYNSIPFPDAGSLGEYCRVSGIRYPALFVTFEEGNN